jgi:rare lipoprotein A
MGGTAASLALTDGASPTAHPAGTYTLMISRIPTRGFVVALLVAGLAMPVTAGADTGGTPAPTPGGTGTIDPSFLLTTSNSVFVGSALQIRGFVANAAGQTINIQSQVATGGWVSVATATADKSGNFATTWYPPTSGQYELRAALSGAQAADSTTASTSHAVRVYKRARASWYGPGFYGKRTACGKRLNRATTGVAHRSLACGTQVAIRYRGRSIVVPVIDRGPFTRGVQWDLTSATAKKLGITVTSRVGVAPIMLPLTAPAI